MNTAATASQNVRDAAKDAREGLRDVKNAANEASGDIQADLQALRDDFARLADQVGAILGTKGSAAWQRARSSVDDIVAGAQDTGREAVGAMREVSDNFVDAIDESIKTRPYTTLAIVAGLGFLFGATWRR
ncbi:MAG TPA: hypothetical protein VK591_17800 [Xanthobacteraceae bacterium]|nr:hypothetical protein [Xanthobacteraceae bacterium]